MILNRERARKSKKYFWEKKEVLLKMEQNTFENHPRLYILHQILMSRPKIFNKNQKTDFEHQNKTLLKSNTKNII